MPVSIFVSKNVSGIERCSSMLFFIFCSSVLFLLRGAGFCFRELVESGRGEGKRQKIEGDKREGERKE